MTVITKQVQLTPQDVFAAIRDMTVDELEQLRILMETAPVEYNAEHDLPESFVRELREGLVEVSEGHVEPFDFSVDPVGNPRRSPCWQLALTRNFIAI